MSELTDAGRNYLTIVHFVDVGKIIDQLEVMIKEHKENDIKEFKPFMAADKGYKLLELLKEYHSFLNKL